MKTFYEADQPLPVSGVVDHIKDGIRCHRYAPGQRLIEADLAAELGVRRGPVREALRILAGDGIVELIPQKGARVRQLGEADIEQLVPVLAALLKLTVRLSRQGLREPTCRTALERAMAGLRSAAALENDELFQKASMRYAAVLKEAAGNRYLDYVEAKLYAELFYRQTAAAIPVEDWPAHLDHHEQMHEALLAGDIDHASLLIERQEQQMLARLQQR